MADSSTPAPVSPSNGNSGGKKTKRRSPGAINRKYLDEIDLSRALITEAGASGHTAALAERGWDAARVTALTTAAAGRVAARKLDTTE